MSSPRPAPLGRNQPGRHRQRSGRRRLLLAAQQLFGLAVIVVLVVGVTHGFTWPFHTAHVGAGEIDATGGTATSGDGGFTVQLPRQPRDVHVTFTSTSVAAATDVGILGVPVGDGVQITTSSQPVDARLTMRVDLAAASVAAGRDVNISDVYIAVRDEGTGSWQPLPSFPDGDSAVLTYPPHFSQFQAFVAGTYDSALRLARAGTGAVSDAAKQALADTAETAEKALELLKTVSGTATAVQWAQLEALGRLAVPENKGQEFCEEHNLAPGWSVPKPAPPIQGCMVRTSEGLELRVWNDSFIPWLLDVPGEVQLTEMENDSDAWAVHLERLSARGRHKLAVPAHGSASVRWPEPLADLAEVLLPGNPDVSALALDTLVVTPLLIPSGAGFDLRTTYKQVDSEMARVLNDIPEGTWTKDAMTQKLEGFRADHAKDLEKRTTSAKAADAAVATAVMTLMVGDTSVCLLDVGTKALEPVEGFQDVIDRATELLVGCVETIEKTLEKAGIEFAGSPALAMTGVVAAPLIAIRLLLTAGQGLASAVDMWRTPAVHVLGPGTESAAETPSTAEPPAGTGSSTVLPPQSPALLAVLPRIGWLGTTDPLDPTDDVPDDQQSISCQREAYARAGIDVGGVTDAERSYAFPGGAGQANMLVIHSPEAATALSAAMPGVIDCLTALVLRSGVFPTGTTFTEFDQPNSLADNFHGGARNFHIAAPGHLFAPLVEFTWFADTQPGRGNFYLVNLIAVDGSEPNIASVFRNDDMAGLIYEDVHH